MFWTRVMSTLTYCGITSAVRQRVPPELRDWKVSFPDYNPCSYQIDFSGKEWADPDIGKHNFRFNQIDGVVDRRSHCGPYSVVDGFPLNPSGRTGLRLRGILGRWGPNHAADPIVTRWKRDRNGQVIQNDRTGRPILQFVAIRRRDTQEWALPGGMVDAGELVSATVKREFMEEALNSLSLTSEQKKELNTRLERLFSEGQEVFKGLVDDRRNTDNAWMETTCFLFHDQTGETFGSVPLEAGDDAVGVQWTDASKELKLYANHSQFIERTAVQLSAHW